MTKKKKAILYCRSACIGNDDALSVQEQMLKKYAKSKGYEIVEVIKESCDGTDLNRPGIKKIYETINRHKVDILIARDISRYGRCSMAKILDFIKDLQKKGVNTLTIADKKLQSFTRVFKAFE